MPLYEVPQPEPEQPETAEPEYDDEAVMTECQRLVDMLGLLGVGVDYAESRVNLADLAPTMQMRAVVRILFAMGVSKAQWAQAVHEELRDTLRTTLTKLEGDRDQPKAPALALPLGYRKH